MIELIMALAAGSGFQYAPQRDRMSDEVTHIAKVDLGNRSSLLVACGASTDGEIVVNFTPGKPLRDLKGGILTPLTNRFRFDRDAPINLEVEYRNDRVLLYGKAAESFFDQAKTKASVVVEYQDFRESLYQQRIPLDGFVAAASAIEKECRRK